MGQLAPLGLLRPAISPTRLDVNQAPRIISDPSGIYAISLPLFSFKFRVSEFQVSCQLRPNRFLLDPPSAVTPWTLSPPFEVPPG